MEDGAEPSVGAPLDPDAEVESKLRAVAEAAAELGRCRSVKELTEAALSTLVEVFGAQLAEAWAAEDGGERLRRLESRGGLPAPDAVIEVASDPSLVASVARQGHPLVTNDLDDGAAAVVPVSLGPELLGVVAMFRAQPIPVPEADVLATFSSVLASTWQTLTLLEREQEGRRRLGLLVEASEVLASTLDYSEVLRAVSELAVGALADWGSVTLVERDGSLRRVAVAHADPAKADLARELEDRFPNDPAAPTGVARVIRTGRPERWSEVSDEILEYTAVDAEYLRILRALGVRSTMIVPLRAGDRTLGALTFVSAQPDRRYTLPDLALAEDLARRAAVAVDSARREAELRELADTLQATLLPPHQPSVPGMEVATRYRPADRQLAVGGDFFDVFRLQRNDWGVVLGDVCGKGARAAAMTALARYTLRAAAVRSFDPVGVLEDVNRSLLTEADADGDEQRFCSAVFGRLELDQCGAWITMAAAGHPRPIVLRRAGWIDVRGQPGMPLGLFEDPMLATDRVGLGPGDALVFFTDGITESRAGDGDELFGEERMPEVLLGLAGQPAEEIARVLVDEALAYGGGRFDDDVAVLVLRVPTAAGDDPEGRLRRALDQPEGELPVPGYPVSRQPDRRVAPPREARILLPGEPQSAAATRRFVEGVLHSWRMSELAGGEVELAASEVAANAVRHARSDFTVIVRYDGERVRIEVGDGSRALPRRRTPSDDDTGGRGIMVVEAVATAWGVMPTVDGKRVWFEVAV